MKILCVDDNRSVRSIYMKGLSRILPNDEFFEAASGEEAVEKLQTQQFDVILTDLVMEILSGLDVLRIVKRYSPATEVIVVTGHATVETVVEAMQAGARDYIEKPIDLSLLKEKIENIRDYHNRITEAEDLRLAKDAYEQQASQEVQLMERCLYGAQEAINHAINAIESKNGKDADDRLHQVATILRTYREKILSAQ